MWISLVIMGLNQHTCGIFGRDLIVQHGDLRCGFVYGFVATPDMETGKEDGNGMQWQRKTKLIHYILSQYCYVKNF